MELYVQYYELNDTEKDLVEQYERIKDQVDASPEDIKRYNLAMWDYARKIIEWVKKKVATNPEKYYVGENGVIPQYNHFDLQHEMDIFISMITVITHKNLRTKKPSFLHSLTHTSSVRFIVDNSVSELYGIFSQYIEEGLI